MFNSKQLINIGNYGFVFETYQPNVVCKIIPDVKRYNVNIVNEYTIQQKLSQISCKMHLYNKITNTMEFVENQSICPKIISQLDYNEFDQSIKKILKNYLYLYNKTDSLGEHYYIYQQEKLDNVISSFIINSPKYYIYIIIYQLIELYQSLIEQNLFNFGHHDLHCDNVGYITNGNLFSIKIFDFGFACFDKIGQDFNHPKYQLTFKHHAILDIMHFIVSIYKLTDDYFLYKIINHHNYNLVDNIFNNFYGIVIDHDNNRLPYRAISKYNIHNITDLEYIKQELKTHLKISYQIKWNSDCDNNKIK